MRVCTSCHQILSEGDPSCARDGAPGQDAQFARIPGQLHARFPAIEPFARGATGSVFLAVQAQSGYRGLLKILAPEAAASATERARLKRELRKQTTLTNNSLARIIDGGEIGTDLWLFRDFVAGDSLAVRLRQGGPLPVPEALAVTAQVASALDEVHRQGLLHRDIKPGHVILTPRVDAVPLVTVIDTGIAARLPTDSVFELLGTPAYIAPEVLAGKPTSFRSDLYALGCLLHEMLMGTPPFTADTVEGVLTAHRELEAQEVSADLPAPVCVLLQSMLSKEPRRRPFSSQQVRRALDPYLPAGTPEPSSGTRTLAGNMAAPRPSSAPPAPEMVANSAFATGSTRKSTPKMPAVSVPGARASAPKIPGLRSAAPPVPGDTMEPGNITQEIDIEQIEAAAAARPPERTQEIDLESVTVPELASAGDGTAPFTPVLDPDATTELRVTPTEPQPSADAVVAGVAGVASGADAAVAARPTPAPAVPAPADATPMKAVDFDVESLFEDDLDEPKQPVITPPEPARPSVPQPPARVSVPQPVFAAAEVDPVAAVEDGETMPAPDPEGTVMLRRPPPPDKQKPWLLIGAAVVLLLVVLAFVMRGHSTGTGSPTADAHATADAPRAPGSAAADEVHAASGQPVAPQPPSGQAPVADPPSANAGTATVAAADANQPTDKRGAAAPAAAEPGAPVAAAGEPAQPEGTSTGDKHAGKTSHAPAPVPYHPPPPAEPGVDYKTKGRDLFQAGKYREAAVAYEHASQQTPSDAGAFAGLGASLLAAEQPDKAIVAYQRAVQLKPKVSGFHAALARAYMKKNDRGRAVAAYKKAVELDPNNQAAKTALAAMSN